MKYTKTITITNENGLDANMCYLLTLCAVYNKDLTFKYNGKNALSILNLMSICRPKGEELLMIVESDERFDSKKVLAEVNELFYIADNYPYSGELWEKIKPR